MKKGQLKSTVIELIELSEKIGGISLIAKEVSVSSDEIRSLAEETMKQLQSGVIVLASKIGERCQIIAQVSDDLIGQGIKANEIIKAVAPIIGGGGGGKANFAQAGGKIPDKIQEALVKAKTLLQA